MPFIPHTPESLLPRSDSKNPATTCKGLTSSGRPCRRTLASSSVPSPSPASSPSRNQPGVLAVLTEEQTNQGVVAAAFFCWQHQDQAERLAAAAPSTVGKQHMNQKTEVVQLKERCSIDTLVDRLGVLDVDVQEQPNPQKKHARKPKRRLSRRETMPKEWQNVSGPLISVPEEVMKEKGYRRSRPASRQPKSNVGLFCCLQAVDDDDLSPANRPPRRTTGMAQKAEYWPSSHGQPQFPRKPLPTAESPAASPRITSNTQMPSPSTPNSRRPSQTSTLLSLIPPELSPQTTAALLTELGKPISAFDEAGWIYMFWLTPTSSSIAPPSPGLASSLLSPPSNTRQPHRRVSETLSAYSQANGETTPLTAKRTVLLKIGRASNVQRRLNEWSRQCGHELSLVRFYPYVATSAVPSPQSTPRRSSQSDPFAASLGSSPPQGLSLGRSTSGEVPQKVPHAHRVERLIHIELAAKQVKRKCEACGREHREWFEVEASKDGLKSVDETVRRWVDWAKKNG